MTSSEGLPSIPIASLTREIASDLDLFICSASFESRCLSVPTALKVTSARNVLVMRNENVQGKGKAHGEKILGRFKERAKLVLVSKTYPIKTADSLVKCISELHLPKKAKCLVDITTMTHEALLILFRVLCNTLPKSVDLQFVYAAAEEYDPGTPQNEKWLSKGLGEVRSILGYPGEMRPSRKSHLIVLVGFEEERARKFIETYEPSVLSLGIGDRSPVSEGHLGVNRAYFQRLIASNPSSKEFSFSPTDPIAVKEVIEDVIRSVDGYNVVVAPMNTKISALGVALAAIENPNVQICYGRATAYNVDNYSSPAKHCYLFKLPRPRANL